MHTVKMKNKEFRLSDLILELRNFIIRKNSIHNISSKRHDRRFIKCL